MAFKRLTRGHLCLAGAAIVWSTGGAIVKAALIDVHPFAIAFYRSLFAALAFALFIRRTSWRFDRKLPFCVAGYAACVLFYLWSIKITTAANAILLQYAWPIWAFLISVFVLKQAVDRQNLLALALGMVGIAIVFAGRGGADDALGIGLALASGVAFAITTILLGFLSTFDSVYLTFVCNLGGALVMLPLAWPHLDTDVSERVTILLMGWFQLGLGWFLFTQGVKTVSAQEAGIITLLEPVLNPLWVAIVVHEFPSSWTLTGGALIVAAFVLRYTVMAKEPRAHT